MLDSTGASAKGGAASQSYVLRGHIPLNATAVAPLKEAKNVRDKPLYSLYFMSITSLWTGSTLDIFWFLFWFVR